MDNRSSGFASSTPIVLDQGTDGVAARSRSLVCFSHLRWDFVWQRPQHIMGRAAQTFDVVFLEEPITRPGILPHLEMARRHPRIRVAVPVLPDGLSEAEAIGAQRQLLERLLATEASDLRVFWYYTPMALEFSGHIPADLVVYDKMDELSAFRGAAPELVANEDELLARADLVFTGGQSLYEAAKGRHPRVSCFPSSIDVDHFAVARAPEIGQPGDQRSIPHPRVGFFGVIDERMDLDLVAGLAALRPDWHLVMIGPIVKIDPATLPRRDNIHWLGPRRYAELPPYLAGWDVGFMPFALNEATRFISPTKTPEFLAAGLPVVSTPIRDVVRTYGERGLVEIAADVGETAQKIEMLTARPRQPWLGRVDRLLAGTSWNATWSAMNRLIEDGLGIDTHVSAGIPAALAGPLE